MSEYITIPSIRSISDGYSNNSIECCNRILEVYPSKSEIHCHKDLILSKQTIEYILICRICKNIIKVPLNKPLKEFITDERIRLIAETFLNNLNK